MNLPSSERESETAASRIPVEAPSLFFFFFFGRISLELKFQGHEIQLFLAAFEGVNSNSASDIF